MKVIIASDHAGFELKEKIINQFKVDFEWVNNGTFSSESVDYPDFAHPLADKVSKGEFEYGILICGLIEPTEGRVLYDGTDIREYNRNEYYRLFGAVFQDYSVLPVTIEEIVAESVGGELDSGKVEECLKKAGLWDKISSLEQGAKTKYDKAFWDDGINLSGGEIQKLLLARALYRQSPIVILDEPTAALDPIAENRLYERYNEIMENKSTIFISHRLASTRFCSRIMLIDRGKILEEGTHEQLLKQKGMYYRLFETQAKYYLENPEKRTETVEDKEAPDEF